MRRASRAGLVVGLAGLLCAALALPLPARAQGRGLTLTPAMLSITLEKGSNQQSTVFSLTNSYDTPVILSFGIEPQLDQVARNDYSPAQWLSLAQSRITLQPGATFKQAVTAHDNQAVGPGSHLADIVIVHGGGGPAAIGVLPSIRLPLTIVKADGAVAGLAIKALPQSRFSWTIPAAAAPRLHNTGNVIAIPRGVITVTAPGGTVVRKGVLNTESKAISPGASLALPVTMQTQGTPLWPGLYKTTLTYSLGGDSPAKGASRSFLYIAWWHAGLLLLVLLGTYHSVRHRHLPRKLGQFRILRWAPKGGP